MSRPNMVLRARMSGSKRCSGVGPRFRARGGDGQLFASPQASLDRVTVGNAEQQPATHPPGSMGARALDYPRWSMATGSLGNR